MQEKITLSQSQLKTLATPVRYEIYSVLRMLEEGSARTIALFSGRESKSIHYHLNALETAGLIEQFDTRPIGKTQERIYRVLYQHLELDLAQNTKENARYTAALLRLAAREVEHARTLELSDEQRASSTHLFRILARLSPADLKTFERKLSEAIRFAQMASLKESGQRVTATILVTPIQSESSPAVRRHHPPGAESNLQE